MDNPFWCNCGAGHKVAVTPYLVETDSGMTGGDRLEMLTFNFGADENAPKRRICMACFDQKMGTTPTPEQ